MLTTYHDDAGHPAPYEQGVIRITGPDRDGIYTTAFQVGTGWVAGEIRSSQDAALAHAIVRRFSLITGEVTPHQAAA